MNKLLDENLKSIIVMFSLLGIDKFNPQTSYSEQWLNWVTNFSLFTCLYCANQNGNVYNVKDKANISIPEHPNCACYLEKLLSIKAGTATIEGLNGADYWIKNYHKLPQYYLTKKEATKLGWIRFSGNLREISCDAVIGGDLYEDKEKNFRRKKVGYGMRQI